MTFDYSRDFQNIDFRKHPELYRIGRGEQGVLLVEPYKSEILVDLRGVDHWQTHNDSGRGFGIHSCRARSN